VAVLGLAFKAGTSDVRRSPGIKLANILAKSGALVTTYDPQAIGEAREVLGPSIKVKHGIEEAIKGADAVFLATKWPEFITYDASVMAGHMKGNLLVDCVNIYNSTDAENAGLTYIGVGRNGNT
jgi:UDPglucose 6-dehydrogenase